MAELSEYDSRLLTDCSNLPFIVTLVGMVNVPVLNSELGSYGSRYYIFLDYY